MVQPIKNKAVKCDKKKIVTTKKRKKHKEYGTSKLEIKFAKNFLDKLGVKYIYQFKAESIGRYYDYMLPDHGLIIEIDGDFYHSYGIVYEEMNPMQKHNKRVDKQKDHWALINGYPIIRIWEHDINKHPEKVMEMLKEKMGIAKKAKEIKDNKKLRQDTRKYDNKNLLPNS